MEFTSNTIRFKYNLFQEVTLIIGPSLTLKTSILFNESLKTCLEVDNGHVIFITSERKAKQRKPLETQFISFSTPKIEFDNLHFKYFDPLQGSAPVFSYLSKLHLLPRQPHLIVFDDLSLFMETFEQKARCINLLESCRSQASIVHNFNHTQTQKEDMDSFSSSSSSEEETDEVPICRVLVADALNDLGEYRDMAALSPSIRGCWVTRSISNNNFRLERSDIASPSTAILYEVKGNKMIQRENGAGK